MASGGNGEQTLRIVMLGKTGAGKSSLGNALLGKTAPKSTGNQGRGTKSSGASKQTGEGFHVGRGLTSETVYCAWDFVSRSGTVLEVTDTPGLCDTHKSVEQTYKEVAKSVAVAKPGPNILIFTLRCDRRLTEEEFKAYMNIKELFSDEISRYLILVFNGLDTYDDEETIAGQRAALANNIEDYGGRMADMIREAGGRYFGMNNKAPRAEKERQVQDLIRMMQDLVKKNGKEAYYKSEMTEQINARVEALIQKEAKATGAAQTEATQKTLRIVMLGRRGVGKSSLGNALLGKTAPKSTGNQRRGTTSPGASKQPGEGFHVCRGMTSESVYCDWDCVSRSGTVLEVTDTRGLCDTHMSEEQIYKEVVKSVALAKPGPNIFIYTLRCDRRFTSEEFEAYRNTKELFSDEISRYLILVFNGLDAFDDEETIEGKRAALAKVIEGYGGRMADMIREAGGRYFGMNNKAPRAEKERQVQDLIRMMQDLVKRNGEEAYYKSEVTEQKYARVKALVEKEAKATGAAQTEATRKVKRDIIEEKVEPGFFSGILNLFKGGVKDMCSVM